MLTELPMKTDFDPVIGYRLFVFELKCKFSAFVNLYVIHKLKND